MSERFILEDQQQKLHQSLDILAKRVLSKDPRSRVAKSAIPKLKVLREGRVESPAHYETKEFEMYLRHYTEIFDV